MPATLDEVNAASPDELAALLDGAFSGSSWAVQPIGARRPFASLAQLKRAMVEVVRAAGRERQLELIRAESWVAGHAGVEGSTIARPRIEGESAWRGACTVEELDTVRRLVAEYEAKFGFPFVLAARGPRGSGLSAAQVIATLERRILGHPEIEFAQALRNLLRIVELRLNDRFGVVPELGNLCWDWAEGLARHSDPGYAERGQLTVTYLTDAHRACARDLASWMREDCGFDSVGIDAVGNVVGVYHGTDPRARRLLTGSHYDTVRNAGRYDGRLGIFVPMACVRALKRAGRRLPFGIEVVGFAEEEGQRYRSAFLASSALAGRFDRRWLDQRDADGISMREAMHHAGLRVDEIPEIAREPAAYLGFVEVHIEQGPVLDELDLPLGIVTSINGSLRYLGEVVGQASHAGTTPMDRRRDAAAAVAEWLLFVERRAASVADLVATVGMLEVPGGSTNVVPGRCRFSLDVRSPADAVRDTAAADMLAELERICARRGTACTTEETMRQGAAPSDPGWQRRWERAVASLGLPLHRMPSGAGHDAMKLHEVMPQAMLFVRGENAGISHNPLESSTADDIQLAVEAMQTLLEQLAEEMR